MAAFGRFSGSRSRSPTSSDGGDGSFAANVDRELQGLADTLDQELGEEAIEPDYETHEFRAPPQAIQIEVEPGYSVVPRDGSSLVGLGQYEHPDLDLPIYATVNKNRKKPDHDHGIDNPVASTSYAAAPPVIVPEIIVNQHDDIDQQSEEGLGEGSRSNRGVSFSADTLDNEGTSRRYRKEKVQLGDIHRGKISAKDAVVTSNPIYESIDQDSNNKIFVNREFTGRTFPDSTVHTIPIIPSNRSYDGSVISYQYIGGESNNNNNPQTFNALPLQPPPQESKPVKQFIPVTVERVGLPPLVAPTVEWSPDPGRSNQDYIIQTDENVSVISINSTSRHVGPFPNGNNRPTQVAIPTRQVAQPVPWPSPKPVSPCHDAFFLRRV